jgi:hypothetical protein
MTFFGGGLVPYFTEKHDAQLQRSWRLSVAGPFLRSRTVYGLVILRIKCAIVASLRPLFVLRHNFNSDEPYYPCPINITTLSPSHTSTTTHTDSTIPRKWCLPMPSPSSLPPSSKRHLVYHSTAHATTLLHELARPPSARPSPSWGLRYVEDG